MSDSIGVVIVKDNVLYRNILGPNQYEILSNGQIKLPSGYYSAGWYTRVFDGDWNILPWEYPDQDKNSVK